MMKLSTLLFFVIATFEGGSWCLAGEQQPPARTTLYNDEVKGQKEIQKPLQPQSLNEEESLLQQQNSLRGQPQQQQQLQLQTLRRSLEGWNEWFNTAGEGDDEDNGSSSSSASNRSGGDPHAGGTTGGGRGGSGLMIGILAAIIVVALLCCCGCCWCYGGM